VTGFVPMPGPQGTSLPIAIPMMARRLPEEPPAPKEDLKPMASTFVPPHMLDVQVRLANAAHSSPAPSNMHGATLSA
jgi:hypothetical protein